MNQTAQIEYAEPPTLTFTRENVGRIAENAMQVGKAHNTIREALKFALCILQLDSEYGRRAIRQALSDAREAAEQLETCTCLAYGFNSPDNVRAWAVRSAIIHSIEATRGPAKFLAQRLRRRIDRALQLHVMRITTEGGWEEEL